MDRKSEGSGGRRQAALLRLGTEIIAAHDEEEVCRCVVNGLHDDALGYDFLGVFLVDETTGDRVLRASVGWPDVPHEWRVAPGQGLSERALLDRKLHYTADVTREASYLPSLNSGSEVDVPLRSDDKVIGVLVVESALPNAFNEEDFEILTAAANQASLAIGRVRLLAEERHRADEQEALLATMADLSKELELSRVLQAVLERAVGLLDASGGELAIYDENEGELEIVANHNIGKQSTGIRLKLGEGAMGGVAQTHEPLIIDDYPQWSGRSSQYGEVNVHAVMVAPLLMGGRLVGAIATVHTRPDRKFTEDDLRLLSMFGSQAAVAIETARLFTNAQQQTAYFEDLFRASPVAIVTLDTEGRVVSCNPFFEKLFGYKMTEIVNDKLDRLITTESMRSEAVGYTQLALDRPVHAIRQRLRKDRSVVEVEIFGVPVMVEGKQVGALGLYHDITELSRAREEAEAANRAKSYFLANMSHELRTPLNAIIGYSELLAEEAEDLGQEEFLPDLEKIRSAGKHLLALINDILDLSKIEAGKIELDLTTFDLANTIEDVVTTVRPLVDKNSNELRIGRLDNLGTIHSDETKVRQVLFNLLSNASKFTQRGTITLTVSRDTADGEERLAFRVADTGVGMDEEQLEKVFEAFSQADSTITRKYGGTGLGLAISRKFCRMLGGDIKVSSEAGKGSVFTVGLPTVSTSARQMAPGGLDTGDRPSATAEHLDGDDVDTVLAIDDDPAALDLLTQFLGRDGFRVVTASGGEEGLRLAKELKPAAITLDVIMPKMDGWAVLGELKADPELSEIPVVMLTILDNQNIGYALGADEYLSKPIDHRRLASVLEKYRRQGQPGAALVVEDDAATREMLGRILDKDGWAVTEAENGRVALEQLEVAPPDLILLDLMMPEMDGFEFVEKVRANDISRSIPIIVITAKELTTEDRLRLNDSVEKIIQKGSRTQDEVLSEIRALVRTRIRSGGNET
ncbi:MAG: response regulator [Acidobacteriota bacterium]